MAITYRSNLDNGGGTITLDSNIPHMTSNNTPSGIASASGEQTNYFAWKAMQRHDYGEYDRWVTSGDNAYIQYKFPNPIKAYLISLKSRANARKSYDAAISCSIQLLGSNDGTNFELIDELTLNKNDADDIMYYSISADNYYLYLRLKFVGHNCEYGSTHYCGLTCLQIIGESEKS